MNTKTKRRLKEVFSKWGATLTPPFSEDESLKGDAQFYSLRRYTMAGQWQFLALSFMPQRDQVFLEVAVSRDDKFPIAACLCDPNDIPVDGVARFRAFRLWSGAGSHGGWVIRAQAPKTNDPFGVVLGTPEGIFETSDGAFDNMKVRIERWVLPFLEQPKHN